MARFRLFLIGAHSGLEVELPAPNLGVLERDLARQRYLRGRMAHADDTGLYPEFLVPAHRVQMICEV